MRRLLGFARRALPPVTEPVQETEGKLPIYPLRLLNSKRRNSDRGPGADRRLVRERHHLRVPAIRPTSLSIECDFRGAGGLSTTEGAYAYDAT
jgi:hypothetical protein